MGKGLGLRNMVAENADAQQQRRWHTVYRIEPVSLRHFAIDVARRLRPLGQDGVELLGDPDRRVSRPAVGVGCGGPDKDMIDAGADVLVVCYDGASYWETRVRLAELGAAVVMVEHGTSEVWGMQSLARYLGETFPELEVRFYDRHPRPFHVA
jgi:putative NIF3 family GTP cyclohydrolase 1 type 2